MASPVLFHWADYVVFALSLASSLVIGLVFAIKDRWHKQSTESYLLGDRNLNVVAVALSMLASTLNAVFLLAGVAEFHYFGTMVLYMAFGNALSNLVTNHATIPMFRKLGKFTSAYEYLERRFNLAVRMVASLVFVIATCPTSRTRISTLP